MMYQGLTTRFPVDRPLTAQDRKYQLRQGERLDLKPYPDLATIKLNSTYLEVVDKFFGMKGQLTGFLSLILIFVLAMPVLFWFDVIVEEHGDASVAWFATIICIPTLLACLYVVSMEAFSYTHYPIRLNRITREVHVFRRSGGLLTVPWDEVFFTLDYNQTFSGRGWEIRGHVLDADRETVRETFAFSVWSVGDAEGFRKLRSHWEFYRRYMEEGPQAVADYIKVCMPIDGRRESFRFGFERIFVEDAAALLQPIGVLMWTIMLPLNLLSVLGRWVAMQTSKLPQWPAEIEAASRTEPDDPYMIDARINPPKLRR